MFLSQLSLAQEKQTFEDSGWQQKDSMITTLYQGGALQVVGVMIEEAYQAEKSKGDSNSEGLAVFSLWQGIKNMTEEKYEEAEKYLDESIAIFKNMPENRSGRYLDALLNMADLQAQLQNVTEHLSNLDQALKLMEADLQNYHGNYHSALLQSIDAAISYGLYDKAQEYGRSALKNAQDAYSNQSDEYFQSLVAVGKIYLAQGETRRASNLILQAYELAKTYLPANHLNRVYYGTNAVSILKSLGRYSTAESTYGEIIQFFEDQPDRKRENIYPAVLDDLGAFYEELGDLDKAYEHYEKANVLFALRLERTDPLYIKSQINVGNILRKQKKYTEAEGYYLDALQHTLNRYGEKNWSEATLRDNLASIYFELGQYPKALDERLRVKEIAEFIWGPNHQEFAYSLLNLGKTYAKIGDVESAKENLETAFTKLTQLFGENHFRVFEASKELASFYEEIDYKSALGKYQSATQFAIYCTQNILPLFADSDRKDLKSDFTKLLSRFTAFTLKHQDELPEAVEALENAFINLRGINQGPDLASMSGYLVEPPTDLRRNYNSWQTLRQKIVSGQALTIAEQKEADLEIDQLLDQLNTLQKEILPVFKSTNFTRNYPTDLRRIKSLIAPEDALIDFHEVLAYDAASDQYTSNGSYLAFVTPGRSAKTKLITLRLNKNVLETDQLSNQTAYSNQIWQPLESLVGDKERLVIFPDGIMHRVSFYTLPIDGGKMLSDQYTIQIFNQPNALSSTNRMNSVDPVLIVGAADLYATVTAPEQVPPLMLRINPKDIATGAERNTRALSQNSTPLSEVQAISAIFTKKKKKVLTKTGKEASKLSLHNALKEDDWSIVQLSVPAFYTEPIDSIQTQLTNAQPINSGLALAGSQTTWKSDSLAKETVDDGLLTAMEIYGLDLSGTDLLMLPNILPGSGTNGHSIYNLINAFQKTGVNNIIYVLWPLSEQDRLIFFQLFYKNLIKSGSVDQAFSKTQNSLKKKQPARLWGGIVLIH